MKYLLLQGLRWCMLLMAVSASAQISTPVANSQLPTGGKVVTGTASIQSVGNVLNINQSSQRSAINWNTFNVGSGAKVNFIQPSASSVTLNRVLDTNGSQILGSISANGQVFISNPNGVLFGPNSQVNVGGLIATTQNISVDDFMAGKSTFEGTGAAGAVVNQGTLEAALGGYIALLAPSVRNEGVVLAREGTVAFAASDKTVVQFNGPQLVTVMVDKPVLDALVENKQMVRADGGLVIFSARSANAVLSSVIRNTGTVQANTIVNKQGRIMLEGGTQGVVEVGGTLQASGIDTGTQGGTISATGDKVSVVSGALLEATGQAGGGNVLVGGGWQGSDPTIQSANAVNIASGAVLNASAIQNGKGGTVVAWSDTQNSAGVTKVQGTLLARGGAEGGDGGRIETSGRWISTGGASGDASAAKGNGGQWLFDPYDVDIISTPGVTNQATNTANTWSPVGNSSTILNSDVTSLLNAGTSVTVLVPTTGGGGLSGNIKVSAPIIQQAASPSANLTLSAYRNLLIDQPITLSGSTGTLQLTAGTGSSALGYISIDNAITANTVSVDNFASGPVTQSFPISANNLRISAPLSNVTLNDTSNQIGALAANVQSLSIKTNQGVDRGSLYGSGMAVGVVGDLTGVTATGDIAMSVMNGNLFVDKSITTTSTTTTALKLNAGASLNTGAYSGSNSVNNPYGPNIILANNFTSTGQTISVGSGGTGLLYTGGYGNSGVSLAGHLGANKSRYNSNEGTTNFSTAVGSGLTAIYRQNPSMVVTGPSASTTYGTAAVFGTNSISGLANSDTSAGMVFGTYSYASNLSTSGNQKAGSYSVVPSGASNGLGYGISYTNGTYSVAQKALTYVSGILANNKTYDGNSVATIDTSNVVISGNITNDVITGGSAQGAFANANAGIAKVVTLSNPVLYGSDAANYSVNLSQLTTNATINQAPAVVTAGSLTTTYSGTTQFILGSNFTATGLVGGETKSVLTGVSASGSGLNAGTYATTASGTDTNYSLTFVPGSLVINPAPLTVTANSRSKTYGDTMTFAGTEFTTSGLQNGQTATSASFTTSGAAATAATSGSPYTITPSALTGGTFNSSNYAITYVNGALTVNRAPLTITANSFTKTYGDAITLTGNEFSTSGLRNSDTTTTATLTTTGAVATAPYSSTPYSITPSAVAGANGFNTTNYSITYVNGGINVSKAPLSVTANSYTKTYGDLMTFSGTEFSSSGLKNSETATNATLISSGSSALASYSSSPYAITPSALAGGTFNANNYSITYNAGNLTVNRAPLTVTANSYTKTYGETKSFAGSEFSTSGFKNNETATTATLTSLGGVSTAAHSITPYPITPSALSGGTFSSNNYNITYSNGGLTVNKANATVIGLSGSTNFDGTTKTLTGFTATGLVNGDILNGVSASTSGRFSGTYLNTPIGTASNYNLNFVSGQLVITGCPGGPPCTAIGPQTTASNITPVVMPATTTPSFASAVLSTTSPTSSAAPVVAFTSSSSGGSLGSGGGTLTLANSNAPTNSVNTVNVISSGNTTTSPSPATSTTTTTIVNAGANPANPAANAVNIATNSPTASPTTSQINAAQGNAIPTANPNTISTATQPNNVVTPQRLADILSKKDPVEIATALPPNQVAQLSPEQVAPLVNSLNLRQLMSLTNEQVAKFEPVRQAELLNIIKVLKDNPEKAAEKAFTPTDKTFAQLAANGLLKEQLDTLSTRITQINQNRTTVNIDTPQKLAELLTKKDPIEIATALPSNQVAQLTPEQAAPLINSLTVRQLMALTNEQISKLDPARQAELLNIINVIKNNPEKAADKAYTAIDKTTAQYVANGLMKEQIDALASRVTQITQSKTTTNIDTPQKLAEILNKNNPVEIASSIPSNIVPQLSSDQVAPLINALSVKQLLSLTNEQMSKLDPTRLAELINILKGLKDNPEKATDKTYTPEDAAVAKYAATGLLKDPIERFSLRANYIADNKFKDPLSKELADLTNPPVPTNVPVARNAPNQANRPLNAAQLAAQNANRETPNLTPAQVAALDPKDLGPLLSQLNANQLLAVTNAQMAGLENAYLNQLTVLLNFVQDRATNPVANAGPATPGNRINNTNIFINQPVAKLAGAALLADQPNVAPLTPPIPASTATLASVSLTPKQVSELDPSQLAALINQLNANQLMAITDAQMARMDGRALNQLTILMNFVQQRTASNNGPANGNNPASGGNTANINVFVNQPVSRLASNALLNEQPKSNEPVGNQSFAQTNITVNLTPRQVSELDPTQLSPLISQLNANQLMAITNTQMARLDTQSINQLNILMNFVQQRALNSNTTTTIYINQPVSRIAAASLMNEQPLPSQLAGAAPTPITTVPLSPQQIANLTPNQIAPLLNRMNSRQLLAVTDTQMANLDSSNLNQLITLLNFIQDSARTSPVVTNNFATRPVAGFLPPELNANQFLNQP